MLMPTFLKSWIGIEMGTYVGKVEPERWHRESVASLLKSLLSLRAPCHGAILPRSSLIVSPGYLASFGNVPGSVKG